VAPVRNVIFDLDGTLVDSLPGIASSVEAALSSCGLPPLARDLKPLIGPPIRVILSTVSGLSKPERLNDLEQAFRASYDSGGWRGTVCQKGAADLLRRLRTSGIGLWVVTNKPADATRKILNELKIASFFQEAACRDSRTPMFRSKADVLADLVQRRALDAPTCLMVGDTLEDCEAAAAAGIRCAIVSHGYWAGQVYPIPAGCRRVSGWQEVTRLCAVALSATERN
jgi:phosphoglycolate phosphatase